MMLEVAKFISSVELMKQDAAWKQFEDVRGRVKYL